ncbi:MAG TPA: ROK family protein [Burkholderiaceae bacterium]
MKKSSYTTPDEVSHGALQLPSVVIDSYSLETREAGEFVGDQASQTAFVQVLDEWRQLLKGRGPDPFGPQATSDLDPQQIHRAANGPDPIAAYAVEKATEEFAERLAHVTETFLRQPAWKGVKRVVVGGGFKQSAIGAQAVAAANRLLHRADCGVELSLLHHEADDAGLIGWVHLAPPGLLEAHQAILSVDIGGTNVRCGIVMIGDEGGAGAHVEHRRKWRHADDEPERADLIEGIVGMLRELIEEAKGAGIGLAPFIGVACPGVIQGDGSIDHGAQNLPGDWNSASFHLPRRLRENIPTLDGQQTLVMMHNDAVVQGLSELPFVQREERWAVLTIGTGLGNASFTNRATRRRADGP